MWFYSSVVVIRKYVVIWIEFFCKNGVFQVKRMEEIEVDLGDLEVKKVVVCRLKSYLVICSV